MTATDVTMAALSLAMLIRASGKVDFLAVECELFAWESRNLIQESKWRVLWMLSRKSSIR
jgi:hypothetical protein